MLRPETIWEAFMKRIRNGLILLMVLFTGGCIGHILREYHRFQADRPIYESVGVNWEAAWHDRVMLNVEWHVGIMRYDAQESAKHGIKQGV